MAIMTHAKFDSNRWMLTLIFDVWASEPPPRPGDRLKRPDLTGLRRKTKVWPSHPVNEKYLSFEAPWVCCSPDATIRSSSYLLGLFWYDLHFGSRKIANIL